MQEKQLKINGVPNEDADNVSTVFLEPISVHLIKHMYVFNI